MSATIHDELLALRACVRAASRTARVARVTLPSWRLAEGGERYFPAHRHTGVAGLVVFSRRLQSYARPLEQGVAPTATGATLGAFRTT